MAVPNYPQHIPMAIAANGDRREIPIASPSGSNQLSFSDGFPSVTGLPLAAGGLPPSREDFNAGLNIISQFMYYMQSGGQILWSDLLDYPVGAEVYYNNIKYKCLVENGANTPVGVQIPFTNFTYWESLAQPERYEVGDVIYWNKSVLPPYLVARNGSVLYNIFVEYPRLVEYLSKPENAELLITETQWLQMHSADPWYGVGGVPFYVMDKAQTYIRLPDTRGMYREVAGFDGMSVNNVHGDMIRNITATVAFNYQKGASADGAMYLSGTEDYGLSADINESWARNNFDASRVVPTGNANKPRAYGVIECVYIGE